MATMLPAMPVQKSNIGLAMARAIEQAQAAERQRQLMLLDHQWRQEESLNRFQREKDLISQRAQAEATAAETVAKFQDAYKRQVEIREFANKRRALEGEPLLAPDYKVGKKALPEDFPGYASASKEDFDTLKQAAASKTATNLTPKEQQEFYKTKAKKEQQDEKYQVAFKEQKLLDMQERAKTAQQQRAMAALMFTQAKRKDRKLVQANQLRERTLKAEYSRLFETASFDKLTKKQKENFNIWQHGYGYAPDANSKLRPKDEISRQIFQQSLASQVQSTQEGGDVLAPVTTKVTSPDPIVDKAMWLRKELYKRAAKDGDWAMAGNIDQAVVSTIRLFQQDAQDLDTSSLTLFKKAVYDDTESYELNATGKRLIDFAVKYSREHTFSRFTEAQKKGWEDMQKPLELPNANAPEEGTPRLPNLNTLTTEELRTLRPDAQGALANWLMLTNPSGQVPTEDLVNAAMENVLGFSRASFANIDTKRIESDIKDVDGSKAQLSPAYYTAKNQLITFLDAARTRVQTYIDDFKRGEFNIPQPNSNQAVAGNQPSATTYWPNANQSVDNNQSFVTTNWPDFTDPVYKPNYFTDKPTSNLSQVDEAYYRKTIGSLLDTYIAHNKGTWIHPAQLENDLYSTKIPTNIIDAFVTRYTLQYNKHVEK